MPSGMSVLTFSPAESPPPRWAPLTRWELCVSHCCVSSSGLFVLWDWIHFAEVSSTKRVRRNTITDSLTNRINYLGLRDFEFLSQRTEDRRSGTETILAEFATCGV